MKNKILYKRSLRTCIIMLVICIVFKLFGVEWFDLNTSIPILQKLDKIIIDPITRVINIPDDYVIGVESDEKSDRMYFQCPKIVGDNVDLSKLKLYVNFENANKERDNYFVNDVTVSEGNILFSWLFSRKVTKYKGDVKFIVCAKNQKIVLH